jgi:hypothetical protein
VSSISLWYEGKVTEKVSEGVTFAVTIVAGGVGDDPTVNLTSSSPDVTFAENAVRVDHTGVRSVAGTVSLTAPSGPVTIKARSAGGNAEKQTTLTIERNRVNEVRVGEPRFIAGEVRSGAVLLLAPAAAGGVTVNIWGSPPGLFALDSESLSIPEGKTSGTFTFRGLAGGDLPGAQGRIWAKRAAEESASRNVDVWVKRNGISRFYFDPRTTAEGGNVTGQVELLGPAVPGGISVALGNSNAAVVTVPATLTVADGRRRATFSATGVSVGSAEITATTPDATTGVRATLTVTSNQVKSVVIAPPRLSRGQTSTATVTLDGPAPPGDVRVDLASSKPADVPVPNFVMVKAGQATQTFSVKAEANAATGSVDITAVRMGSTAAKTGRLNVVGAQLKSVSMSPRSIREGATSTGTVTLDVPADAGGVKVALAATGSNVTLPAEVAVPEGADTATFSVTATGAGNVSIAASTPGVEQRVGLVVSRNEIKSVKVSPSTIRLGESATGTITLEAPAGSSGMVVAVASSGSAVTVPSEVTVAAGASEATFPATGSSGGTATISVKRRDGREEKQASLLTVRGIEVRSLAFPARLVEGSTFTGKVALDGVAGAAGVAVALSSSSASLPVPASVTVEPGKAVAEFTGTAGSAGSATITGKRSGSSVEAQETVTVNPNEVKSVTLSPASVAEGKTSTGTVTLDAPAGASGVTVALASSSAGVTVPADVTVAAGQTSATFTATGRSAGSATLSAKRSGSSTEKQAALSVTTVQVKSVTFSPVEVKAGASVTGTITLDAPAPPNFSVRLRTTSASVTVPATVTVSAGSTTATFTVSAPAKATAGQATIEAERSASNKVSATLTVKK